MLSLILGAMILVKRRRLTIPGATSILRRVDGNVAPTARPARTTSLNLPLSPDTDRCPFGAKDIALTGPGAEDTVRHLALHELTGQRSDAVEVVIARSDAWRLFGVDVGILREERIPGLTLIDDTQETGAYLSLQWPVRRILITCNDQPEDVRQLLSHQPSRLAIVSLAPRTELSLEVSADGEVVRSPATAHMPERLPLVPRQDAFESLMRLPTLATRPAE